MNNNFKDQIRKKIQTIAPITDETWIELNKIFFVEELKSNEKLLQPGEIAKHIYFIHEGLIRSYIVTEKGEEFSKSIISSNNFFSPITSLVTNNPSIQYVESLTNCIISKAKYSDLEALHFKHRDLEHFYRKQMEWLYVYYERSEIERATQDASQRYLNLRKRIPEIDNLIPQYKIATHLGITNVQLSRIRKNLK
jgi:CRP-like cAMP-binding protein